MFAEIIISILAIVIIIQQILYYKLIKDLTLKIKARDLAEYERITQKPVKKKIEPEVISAEEAEATDYLKALKKINKWPRK